MWESTEQNVRPGMRDWVSLTKPRIVAVSVFAALTGALLSAENLSSISVGALCGVAMIVAAASALNMVIERESDRRMSRTRRRPLASGRIAARRAVMASLFVGGGGLLSLLIWGGPTAMLLGAAALILYVGIYTPLKRRTSLAFFVGIIPGAMPPLIGSASISQAIDGAGMTLFWFVLIWQIPHVMALSVWLEKDYARGGITVLPAVIGRRAAAIFGLTGALMLVLAAPFIDVPIPISDVGRWVLVGASIGFSISVLRGCGRNPQPAWSHQAFRVSLVYLVGVFAMLVGERLLT